VSSMAEERRPRRPRRSFTGEFRAGAVKLVLDGGKTIPQVARDLDLTQSALRLGGASPGGRREREARGADQ